jgi:hypothetical protein
MTSWLHVVAVVKGAQEGDAYAHFASLFGFRAHVDAAAGLGFVDGQAYRDDVTVTDAGRSFYERFRLAELPAGRAANWLTARLPVARAAVSELERRAVLGSGVDTP